MTTYLSEAQTKSTEVEGLHTFYKYEYWLGHLHAARRVRDKIRITFRFMIVMYWIRYHLCRKKTIILQIESGKQRDGSQVKQEVH